MGPAGFLAELHAARQVLRHSLEAMAPSPLPAAAAERAALREGLLFEARVAWGHWLAAVAHATPLAVGGHWLAAPA